MRDNEYSSPFYIGQQVIATRAFYISKFINGKQYTVTSCEYLKSPRLSITIKGNPVEKGKYLWYVGINGSACDYTSSIFSMKKYSLKQVL